MTSSETLRKRFVQALDGVPLPAGVVDLAAFDANVFQVRDAVSSSRVKVRVASKSLRCRALLARARDGLGDRYAGVLAYDAREAAWLGATGLGAMLVAYPAVRPESLRAAAEGAANGLSITLMADDPWHVDQAAESLRRHAPGATLGMAIDVDMSARLLGGRLHVGVRRSPLVEPPAVVALARKIAETPGLRFDGVMGYEAQIAGLTDRRTDGRVDPIAALAKRVSRSVVLQRRAEIVAALDRAGLAASLVNGAGSGSLEWSARDPSLTEVTAGSRFVDSHLFDRYDTFRPQPALGYALPVVRIPGPGLVTVAGGGFIASGSVSSDRWPVPWLPQGLTLLDAEGAGEVQTPLAHDGRTPLGLGDLVFFRHAKAGELAERVDAYVLCGPDGTTETAPTYRGEGRNFG